MKQLRYILITIILCCTSVNSQWQQTAGIPQGAGVTDMVVLPDGTIIVTTASFNWPNGQPGGIRRSTDGGGTWQNINNVYNARTLWLGSTGKIFASYWPYPNSESAYYSTNNGVSWILLLTLTGTNNIFSIASKNNDSTVFLGTRDGIRRTTNNGNSFINLTNGLPANSWVRDLAIAPDGTIAAATTNGIFFSTNNGNLWQPVTGIPAGDTVTSVTVDTAASDGENMLWYFGSNHGNLYKADGNNQQIIITQAQLIASNTEIIVPRIPLNFSSYYKFLAAYSAVNAPNGGIYHSSNGGSNWTQFNEGMTRSQASVLISQMFFPSDNSIGYNLYAGMFENADNGAKVFKRTVPIGIHPISTEVPDGFSLSQNYPNPFNPTTSIEFSLPKLSFVKLVVYDMLGREVETLVSKDLHAGTYKADWNASGYSSGLYFYKIEAAGFTQTNKMMLIK